MHILQKCIHLFYTGDSTILSDLMLYAQEQVEFSAAGMQPCLLSRLATKTTRLQLQPVRLEWLAKKAPHFTYGTSPLVKASQLHCFFGHQTAQRRPRNIWHPYQNFVFKNFQIDEGSKQKTKFSAPCNFPPK